MFSSLNWMVLQKKRKKKATLVKNTQIRNALPSYALFPSETIFAWFEFTYSKVIGSCILCL